MPSFPISSLNASEEDILEGTPAPELFSPKIPKLEFPNISKDPLAVAVEIGLKNQFKKYDKKKSEELPKNNKYTDPLTIVVEDSLRKF